MIGCRDRRPVRPVTIVSPLVRDPVVPCGLVSLTSSVPEVLFVCVHNAGRSQMAAGFLRHLAGDSVRVRSAGSMPADRINPAVLEAMAERGIDLGTNLPSKLSQENVSAADVVVTMGCGDACPVLPGKRYLDWALDDPAGKGVSGVRPVRDEIEGLVRDLLTDLGGEAFS